MRNHKLIKLPTAESWFLLFLAAHLAAWTLVPAMVRLNLPLDSIEGALWGQHLQWGYDKNPFLNGWLTALAVHLGGRSGWMIYLFSQFSVVMCLFFVWMLGKRIMPPVYALVSVLLLETIQYFNLHAIDFNDNTLELGLWAGGTYFFYQALRRQNILSWVMAGAFLGLAMMAKYYTLALITALGLFLLRKENRGQLLTISPYFGLATFIGIISPHVNWLTHNDFITVKYVFARASAEPSWLNHLFFPSQFIWQQLEAFAPALVIFALLFLGKKPRTATPAPIMSAFDKSFIKYAALGPILLTALLSLIFGIKLRAGWGMPLLSFWTLLLVTMLPPRLSTTKIVSLIVGIFLFLSTLLAGYTLSITNSKDTSSANYPGKEIAETITHEWNKRYKTHLKYVAGSRWVGGNIAFYSKRRPSVLIEWDKSRAQWVSLGKMNRTGAVFVWEISGNETLPASVIKRYPRLSNPEVFTFDWKRNKHNLPPVKIGVAFLPPLHYKG